uniref:Uncharacterized protein n=1 Tax=Rhizophora mucronata TaxID=61149 RepID=A0A2P2KS80_RHIMU
MLLISISIPCNIIPDLREVIGSHFIH